MKAVSIHFSPPAVVISGLLARMKAMKAKAMRKRSSVVRISLRFLRAQSMMDRGP